MGRYSVRNSERRVRSSSATKPLVTSRLEDVDARDARSAGGLGGALVGASSMFAKFSRPSLSRMTSPNGLTSRISLNVHAQRKSEEAWKFT